MLVSPATGPAADLRHDPSAGRLWPIRSRRRGAVLVIAALLLVALVGMMAVTLECGSLMVERRRAQAIADAAATAAACDLAYNFGFNLGTDPQGTAVASALTTAAAAGYANDGITSTVTVNIPPTSGDYLGKAGYVEVLVQPQPIARLQRDLWRRDATGRRPVSGPRSMADLPNRAAGP